MPKQIDLHTPAREKLLRGAQILARTVAVTYGPKGRTVILDRASGMLATKDGVTVAREVEVSDPVENMGVQTLKEACIRVNDQVGDGTTSVAILSAVLLEEGHRLVVAGFDPMQIAKEIKDAAQVACDVVESIAIKLETQEEVERVAFVASNGDVAVSKALAEACMAVGNDGTISIEDGHGIGIDLVFKEGMEIDKGVVSAGFLRDHGGTERVIENPLVAVLPGRVATLEDIQQVLEESSQWPNNDLVIFAVSTEGVALSTMLVNDSQDVVRSVAINAPGFATKRQEHLKDLAAVTGATFADPEMGLDFRKGFDPEWFGALRKITVTAKGSILVAHDEARETINERIGELKREGASLDSDYERDQMAERIAKLAGGLCVMQVGGATEFELKERRARVEDALGAVRCALEEGVVPGAGSAYLTAADALDETILGAKALAKALRTPLKVLAHNAGADGPSILSECMTARKGDEYGWIGWDVMVGDFRDLGADPPVIDPAPVVRSVIEAAASVTATLLTAEVAVSEA